MSAPLASVIIPVRNGAATIEDQLRALSGQGYQGSWELIVADNASTDSTLEIVERWAEKLPAVGVVDASARNGMNYARNLGVREAKGDILIFCDADDVADPGWLEAMINAALEFDVVAGALDHSSLQQHQGLDLRSDTALRPIFGFLPIAHGSNCAVRAKVLEDLGGWNEEYSRVTGTELSWRAQLGGYRLGYAPQAVMKIRHRPSLADAAGQAYGTALHYARLYRDFRHKGMPPSSMKTLAWDWFRIVLGFVPYMLAGQQRRRSWVRMAAFRLGRVRGSIRYRALYL